MKFRTHLILTLVALTLAIALTAVATAPPLTGVTTLSSGGLSAPDILATSLGLKNAMQNVAINASSTSQVITLALPEIDTSYGLSCTPSWNTTVWATSKTTTSYTLNYATAPGGALMDCILYRTAS